MKKINELPTVEALKYQAKPGPSAHDYVILITVVDIDTGQVFCYEAWKIKGYRAAIDRATQCRRGEYVLHLFGDMRFKGFEVKVIDTTQGKEVYRRRSVSNSRMRELKGR